MATLSVTNNNNTLTITYSYSSNKFSITDAYITVNKANSGDCEWGPGYYVFFDAIFKVKTWKNDGTFNEATLLQCNYDYKNGMYYDDSGITTWGTLGFTGTTDTPRKIQLHKILKSTNQTTIQTVNNFTNSSGKSTWNSGTTLNNSSSNLVNIEFSINIRGLNSDGTWSSIFFNGKENQFFVFPESTGSILFSNEISVPTVTIPSTGDLFNINSKFKLMFCVYNINTTAKTASLYVCPILK